ncbi:MAG TPA: hypothetical protein VNA21_01340 [Steroidobacteraceae bacterium]|nr:hypothetical protein [Steroidobacteraceae bacterium]
MTRAHEVLGVTFKTIIACIACSSADAYEHELFLQADVRAVAVDSPLQSFTEGGMGLLRFDEEHDGVQLGRVLLDVAGPLRETFHYTLSASATDDGDQNPLDLTEAYIDWRPYPQSAWRWRARGGAFYAPISLENRAIGWQSTYSLSPSAINTWVGEEMRTIGVEVASTSLGRQAGRSFDITILGAAYAWNDPMGVLILQRGWGIHDRQTPLFGSLPRPLIQDPDNTTIEFFDEIDDRVGYYVGAEIKWTDDSLIRLMHYDNLGDPDDRTAKEPAWATKFDALGGRLELPHDISLLTQVMFGETEAGPQGNGRGIFVVEFWSYYLLASQRWGDHRYTVRYDRLYTDTERGARLLRSVQNATAWTAAYLFDLDDHWQFAVEGVRISGSLAQRAAVGAPVQATERQLQLAVRWTF